MAKTVKEIAEQIQADPDSVPIGRDVVRGLDSFGKEDRSFDCRKCGKYYTPAPTQWIFYELCDECFTHFGTQKMLGRWGLLGCEPMRPYTESSDEWLANTAFYDSAVADYMARNDEKMKRTLKEHLMVSRAKEALEKFKKDQALKYAEEHFEEALRKTQGGE